MEIIIQENLQKLFQLRPIVSIIALILLAAVFTVIRKKAVFNTRILTYGAVALAASFVLSYIKLFQLPNGGTITVASMLPLFIFAIMAGPGAGMVAGLCYGMLQFIQEPIMVHWVQFLLDYPLAFASLGLAGFYRKNIYLGVVTGSTGRLLCHFLSGVIFFAEYTPAGQNVFIYSLLYNVSYILPDLAICLIVLAIPSMRAVIGRLKVSLN